MRDARILSLLARERKSARWMRKEEVNISSAAISSVSIYDDEVTRYRVRECRAFEYERMHSDIFSLPRENLSPSRISEKEEKRREAFEKVHLTVKILRLDSQK